MKSLIDKLLLNKVKLTSDRDILTYEVLKADLLVVMNELKNIDKVAFIRFASVYREFEDLGEFKSQIDDLSN